MIEKNIKRLFRKSLLIMLLFNLSQTLSAQYTTENSVRRRAIIKFEKDSLGFFQQSENVYQDTVLNVVSMYAFDKSSSNLYVITDKGNYEITLQKELAKVIKKNKDIPHLKGEGLIAAVKKANTNLIAHFIGLNELQSRKLEVARQKYISDSIREARDLARLEEMRRDSLEKRELYISNHKWIRVPVGRNTINCIEPECNHSISKDTVTCFGIKGDTIYYIDDEILALGYSVSKLHFGKISATLQKSADFRLHLTAFEDSLKRLDLTPDVVMYHNAQEIENVVARVRRSAPYGFIEKWGWDNEYSLSFHFTYRNLNKKTIKYIQVFWKLKNAVGDIRKVGSFSGTGPVENGEAASWNWDHSSYYVVGDVTNMELTKIILTYMDGTKKILTGDLIVIDDSEEDD